MNYVIVDLEATCWQTGQTPARMEIIEIGAVFMPSAASEPTREFGKFVRPVSEPELSDFCKSLTTIKQEDVNRAEIFAEVFPQFLEWIGAEKFVICSWGAYDIKQFRIDCERHGIEFPASFNNHINLKKEFARLENIKKPCGMTGALAMLGIRLEGTHHRGIDDARNIAKIAQNILPRIEAETARA